jgi:predicted aspartyl protease
MGTFSVEIGVGDAAGQTFETVEALVDTGATNTTLPSEMLARLGIRLYRKAMFEYPDGRAEELDIGRTWVRVDGQQEFTQVVFGPEGTDPILGAVTLEEMGLAGDAAGRRLVSVTKYLK